MKKALVGSKNPVKIEAVRQVLYPEFSVSGTAAASEVSDQPFSDVETREGAVNRARHVQKRADIGIGLEGGVQAEENDIYLVSWGALTDGTGTWTAGGARILLPEHIAAMLRDGVELKTAVDHYSQLTDTHQNEGAVGILTAGRVDRTALFHHVVSLLYGQWLHQTGRRF
ncbi:DUF84 domain-containing protein [Marinococcus halophilus]|uniref:inosine/xanthosine triphosphatase n=1 Tax=Marinococcus halophilus TaxID=1371 RepID=A0A510Y873_MARHA|nr:DUF84 family protein [Marinococcus halophilus]OZT79382.1 DUF84 domain-containing protein [Marinococcus halophilus]GEK59566.1 NTPase [Marinococcus halophilus]